MSTPAAAKYFSEDSVNKEVGFLQMLGLLWPFMKQRRRALLGVLLLVISYVLVSRALPFIFGHAVDEGLVKKNLSIIWPLALTYLIFEAFKVVLQFCQNFFMQKIANRVLYDVRERLIVHLQSLPLRYFDKNPIGRIVTRVTNDVLSIGDLFTQGFTAFFVNTIELASILIALFIVSAPLAAMTLIVAPIMIWSVVKISARLRHHFKESKKKLAIINAYTAESISGMKIIQLFNRQRQSQMRFQEMSEDFRMEQLKTVRLFATLWPVVEFFNIGTVTAALLFGAWLHSQSSLTIGELSAFIILTQSFFRPLRLILERYNTLQNSLASADRVFHLLEEAEDQANTAQGQTTLLKGEIRVRNLWFRYDSQLPWVLKNINVDIRPGECLAIVGRTGSGKSSFVNVLQKMYGYEKGEIFFDDLDLRSLHGTSLRQHIGVVQQDNFIFKGSVASNISLEQSSMALETIRRAAEKAHCLHLGLDRKVEERGANLSAGERQLIAFARILAFDPEILILDEATSNIDSVNERRIQKATRQVTQGRTSILVAHRLSTIIHADRILVLDQGEIVESGTFAELMQQKGHFHKMYMAQQLEPSGPTA